MLNVDEALHLIDCNIDKLDIQERYLLDTIRQVAAENVYAGIDVPDWQSADQDGYAVRVQDIKGANTQNPRALKVLATVKPGCIAKQCVMPGTTIHVMTGTMIPKDADCIVRFEDTDEAIRLQDVKNTNLKMIGIQHEEKTGNNIRLAGENIRKGSLAIANGQVMGPAEISILASLGYTRFKVIRRPRVAIISTGNELIKPGKSIRYGQLFDGNAYGIAAQVIHCGGIPLILGIAKDNKSSLLAKIRRVPAVDLILTTGGVAVAEHDLIRDLISEIGEVVFWKVSMSPGKPFTFAFIHTPGNDGKTKNIPHFALVGSAPSSTVNFQVLVRPAILKMMGKTNLNPSTVEAITENALKNNKKARRYIWVKIENRKGIYYATPTSEGLKDIMTGISLANGLAIIPEDKLIVNKGDKLQVMIFNWHGEDI